MTPVPVTPARAPRLTSKPADLAVVPRYSFPHVCAPVDCAICRWILAHE